MNIKYQCNQICRSTGMSAREAWASLWADARQLPGGWNTDEVGKLVYWVRRARSADAPHPERLARRAQGRFPQGSRLRIVGW